MNRSPKKSPGITLALLCLLLCARSDPIESERILLPVRQGYKDGKAGTRDPKGAQEIVAEVKQAPLALPELPWVALLFDRGTASSGEAIAISFAGRARERSFGEHTAGFSTANNMHQLPDGAVLFLCDGVELDRTGKLYPDGLDPDEQVPPPETHPDEPHDAALIAAEKWLSKQTSGSH